MSNQDEIILASMLYDCLNPDERQVVHEMLEALSSDRGCADDSPAPKQKTI